MLLPSLRKALQKAGDELSGSGTFRWGEGILPTATVNKLMTG